MTTDTPLPPLDRDALAKAMSRAFSLGQTYWQQADSESYSQNAKSGETSAKFLALTAETVAAFDSACALAAHAHAPAAPSVEPVARVLHWHGPSHLPVPHGGIAARTFAEFPAAEADKPDAYWKNGAPLYTAAPPQDARDAARYRALRSHCFIDQGVIGFGAGFRQTAPELLDEQVDAIRALATQDTQS